MIRTSRQWVIGSIVVVVAVLTFALYHYFATFEYVKTIAYETTSFSALLDSQTTASLETLTPGQATVLRSQLLSHLGIIVDTIDVAEKVSRSIPLRYENQLLASLQLLEQDLAMHRATLVHIDATVHQELADDAVWQSSIEHLETTITELKAHLSAVKS